MLMVSVRLASDQRHRIAGYGSAVGHSARVRSPHGVQSTWAWTSVSSMPSSSASRVAASRTLTVRSMVSVGLPMPYHRLSSMARMLPSCLLHEHVDDADAVLRLVGEEVRPDVGLDVGVAACPWACRGRPAGVRRHAAAASSRGPFSRRFPYGRPSVPASATLEAQGMAGRAERPRM